MIEIYVGGSCFNQGANQEGTITFGIVAIKAGKMVRRITRVVGREKSTDSEYMAIIEGIKLLKDFEIEEIKWICTDSKSIADLINKLADERINIESFLFTHYI